MRKTIIYLWATRMSKISLFLENLNPRERILLLILLAFLGIFLGSQSYENFFDQIATLEEQDLLEKREEKLTLQKDRVELEQELKSQKQKLDLYQNKTQIFNLGYENYMTTLRQLNQKYELDIKNLQSFENEQGYFKKYVLTLQVQGEFESLLQFIQELENLNCKLYYIELENSTSLRLTLKIKFCFLVLTVVNAL